MYPTYRTVFVTWSERPWTWLLVAPRTKQSKQRTISSRCCVLPELLAGEGKRCLHLISCFQSSVQAVVWSSPVWIGSQTLDSCWNWVHKKLSHFRNTRWRSWTRCGEPGRCQAGGETSVKVMAVYLNLKLSDKENMLRKKVNRSASRGKQRGNRWFLLLSSKNLVSSFSGWVP